MDMPVIEANGMRMPRIGLGTWPLKGAECQGAVESALALGYRHLDTAEMYGNEAEVGAGLAATLLRRDAVFLTTKIWNDKTNGDAIRRAFDASLKRLATPYVDLLLIHWPSPALDLASVLTALAELHAEGLARAVGVSNFPSKLLRRALDLGIAPIACLQVEQHAMLGQQKLLDVTQPADIVTTSYTPLGKGEMLAHPVLTGIAARHGATPAQVALAWLLSKRLVAAIPKAAGPVRQAENLAAARLTLTDADLTAIAALPKQRRFVNPAFAPEWDC